MESLSSESKSIALDILEDILSAIGRLEDRTKDVQTTDDFLCSSSGMILLDATCMSQEPRESDMKVYIQNKEKDENTTN